VAHAGATASVTAEIANTITCLRIRGLLKA
jgi:hypothetical protein